MGKEKPPIDTGRPVDPVIRDSLPDSLTHLIVKWNNPDRAYLYYRCVRDTNAFFPYMMRNGNYITSDSMGIVSSNQYTGDPFKGGDSAMPVIDLPEPGRYKIILFTTTPDYRSMITEIADTVQQDFWGKSPTNIHSGLGFFTSFSFDSVFFTIAGKDSVGG